MRDEAKADPATAALVDGLAPSIAFPTIIRDRTSGQGIPLGFIVAVDNEYDEQFGLTTVDGEPVQMEDLRTGVGNIFAQASNLFRWADSMGINVDSGAAAIAQAGALLTQGQDLLGQFTQPAPAPQAEPVVEPPVQPTTQPLGEPTTSPTKQAAAQPTGEPTPQSTNQQAPPPADCRPTKQAAVQPTVEPTPQSPMPQTLDLPAIGNALGIDPSTILSQTLDLSAIGLGTIDLGALSSAVLTDTFDIAAIGNALGIDTEAVLSAVNLNTLGTEIDRVLEQVGLELRQGDVYLNRLGAEQLNAQPGDILDIYIGPIPVPFRVRAIVEEAGPLGALTPVVMLRLDEAQELLFMRGRVNNVLVSNTGDAYTGMENTAAAARHLRALALNEEALTELVALLREPAMLAGVQAGADGSDALHGRRVHARPSAYV